MLITRVFAAGDIFFHFIGTLVKLRSVRNCIFIHKLHNYAVLLIAPQLRQNGVVEAEMYDAGLLPERTQKGAVSL